ncbi:autotransporter domain-containing protein [Sphingomonas fennica]|nr:autotransporter domain-containing protein [Sphingomonas fennica]
MAHPAEEINVVNSQAGSKGKSRSERFASLLLASVAASALSASPAYATGAGGPGPAGVVNTPGSGGSGDGQGGFGGTGLVGTATSGTQGTPDGRGGFGGNGAGLPGGAGGVGGFVGGGTLGADLTGQAGQNAYDTVGMNAGGGGGGGGGVGLLLNLANAEWTNNWIIRGGTGGIGSFGTGGGGYHGGSGGGGTGAVITGSGLFENNNSIFGGNGGATVWDFESPQKSGGAGGGGSGLIVLASDSIVLNSGVIRGGDSSGPPSLAGEGGSAVKIIGDRNHFINQTSGILEKGTGADRSYDGIGADVAPVVTILGSNSVFENRGQLAASDGSHAGIIVQGDEHRIINEGTISSGLDGTLAIGIQGDRNTLELRAESGIFGISAAQGADNTLSLGGAQNAVFNVASLGDIGDLDKAYWGFQNFEKIGDSTWTLEGGTSQVTSWTIRDGTLGFTNAGALGAASGVITLDGGKLYANGISNIVPHAINLASTGQIIVDGHMSADGVITGSVALSKNGFGTLQLSNPNNSYSGGTVVNAGTLSLYNATIGSAYTSAGTGAIRVRGNGALQARGGGILTNELGLGGALLVESGATLTLTGPLSLAGDVTLGSPYDTGTIDIQSALDPDPVVKANSLKIAGGRVRSNYSFNWAIADLLDFRVEAGAAWEVNSDANPSGLFGNGRIEIAQSAVLNPGGGDFGGTITGQGGLVVGSDGMMWHAPGATGLLTLSGFNDYQGNTFVYENAELIAATPYTLPSTTALTLDGTLSANANQSVASLSDTNGASGTLALGANVIFAAGSDNSDTLFKGKILGMTGNFQKIGDGTLTLTGTETGVRNFEVKGGRVNIDGAADTYQTSVDSGAHLTVNGQLDGALIVAGTLSGTGRVGEALLLTGGVLEGVQGQTLDLARLDVSGGTLRADLATPDTTPLFNVSGDLFLDGTLEVTSPETLGQGIYRLIDFGGALSGNGLNVDGAPGMVLSAGGGALNLLNIGDAVLNIWTGDGASIGGSGTWSGTSNTWMDLDGAIAGPMIPQPGFAVFDGPSGSIDVDGPVSVMGMQFKASGYTLAGGQIFLASDTAAITVDGATGVAEIGSEITGMNGFVKQGQGQLILSGENSYAGTTVISRGTLALAAGGSIGSSDLIVGTNGVFDITAATGIAQIDGLRGDGQVKLGSNGLRISAASGTFGGDISGTGDVIVDYGVQKLSGINSYLGKTRVEDGAHLIIAGEGSIASSSAVEVEGTLALGEATRDTHVISLSGAGQVILGDHDLIITNGSGTFAGAIAGDGGVEIAGGSMTISGSNTYSGKTRVAGSLVAGAPNTLSSQSDTAVDASGALDLGGYSQTVTYVTLNGGTVQNGELHGSLTSHGGIIADLRVNPAGTLDPAKQVLFASGTTVLGGANKFSRVTVQGTVDLAGGTHGITDTILAGGVIRNGSVTGKISSNGGAIEDLGGSATLAAGSGTTVLRGSNTYFGHTTIGGGAVLTAENDAAFSKNSEVRLLTGPTGGTGTLDLGGFAHAIDQVTVGRGGGTIRNGTLAGHVTAQGATIENVGGAMSMEVVAGKGTALEQITTIMGHNTYYGATSVSAGATLRVDGELTQSEVTVGSGGVLSGVGTIGSDVVLANGAMLIGRSGDTLGIGSLSLSETSYVDVVLDAALGSSPLFDVGGDLVLDGQLSVSAPNGLAAGVYSLIRYGGTLTNNGLELITAPGASGYSTRATHGSVDLLNANGLTLNFWNGDGQTTGRIAGGSGIWSNSNANWTDADALVNAAMAPQPGFAVFEGEAGKVTVAQDAYGHGPSVTGMQFLTSGYVIEGDAIALTAERTAIRVGAGTTPADAAISATIASALTGAAGLEKLDGGTLVLAGANSYTGETRITGGTLALGRLGSIASSSGVVADGTLDISATSILPDGPGRAVGAAIRTLSGSGKVALGDRTLFIDAADGVFAGTIEGSGGLTIRGGTQTLAGASRFTGETRIAGDDVPATLALTGTGSIAASSRVVVDGTLDISASNDGASIRSLAGGGNVVLGAQTLNVTAGDDTFTGVISGKGGLKLTGGTLGLSGANSYEGDTLIAAEAQDGTARLIALTDQALSSASALTVGTRGVLDLNGRIQSGVSVELAGGRIENGTIDGGVVSTGGSLDNVLGDITVRTTAGTTSVSNRFGGSLIVDGGIVEVKDGANVAGTATLNGGRFGLQGNVAGMVEVNDGGYLHGNGKMGGLIVHDGGALAPGNSLGKLTVAGDALFEAGSVYQVEIDDAGGHDALAVGGTVTIEGGLVEVTAADGDYRQDRSYVIISAGETVEGTFDDVTSNLAFLDLTLRYDPATVWLDATRNDVAFSSLATTANGKAVATQAQALGGGHGVYDAITGLADDGSPQRAFDSLSGEIHASALGQMVEDSQLLRSAVLRHGLTRSEGGWTGLWMETMGAWSDVGGNGNAAALKSSSYGGTMGLDLTLGDHLTIGVSGGWSKTDLTVAARASKSELESTHIAAYGRARLGDLGIRLGAAWSWHDLSTTREVAVGSLAQSLSSHRDGRTAQAFGEIGYSLTLSGARVEPYAGLAWVAARGKGFAETGGSAALAGTSTKKDVTFATLGTRISLPFSSAALAPTFRGKAEWRHAFGDRTPGADLRFVDSGEGAGAFGIAGTPIGKDAAIVEAGIDVPLARSVVLGAGYSARIADQANDHRVRASLNIRF